MGGKSFLNIFKYNAQHMPLQKHKNKGHHNDWNAPQPGFATAGVSGTFAAKPNAESPGQGSSWSLPLEWQAFLGCQPEGTSWVWTGKCSSSGGGNWHDEAAAPRPTTRVCYDVSTRRWPPQETRHAIRGATGNLPGSLRYLSFLLRQHLQRRKIHSLPC